MAIEDWQRPYLPGTLVLWPPDRVRHVVNRLRETHDPASQAICEAHITLTQPFRRSPKDEDLEAIGEQLRAVSPFDCTYGPLELVADACIWFKVQPSEQIVILRDSLHATGLFNLDLPYTTGFIPHMTVTEGLSEEKVTPERFEHLVATTSGGSFRCESVAYIVPDDTFRFSVRRTFAFTGVT